MDRHLNTFVPYERPLTHEDQLTRAAMILMRAVPLARDVLLARIDELPSARLPDVEVDMQTARVLELGDDGDEPSLRRLVSVFLSPDEQLDLSGSEIRERERGQRLDGVLRFGDELVVVVESKIVRDASSDQAVELRLGDAEVEHARAVAVSWHDLIEDWWSLVERHLLAPAESVLVEDLIAFAEDHFPALLPFTTLARAGQNPLRRQRRHMALLREATTIAEVRESSPFGAMVMVDAALGTVSTQRLVVAEQDGSLTLSTWPGELKPQAEALYRTQRAPRLLDLAIRDGWHVTPNPYLGYRGARTDAQRLYLTCQLDLAEYVGRWRSDDFPYIRAHRHDEVREHLWPWLMERGYASAQDDQRLDAFLDGLGRRDAHLRPGVQVRRVWPLADAEESDEHGVLVAELRDAIVELLTMLDEPVPTSQGLPSRVS